MDGAFAGNEVFFCLTKLQRMERFFLRSNSKVVMVLFFSKKKTSRKQKAFPFEAGKGGVGHWSSQGTVQTAAARGSRARGTGSSGPRRVGELERRTGHFQGCCCALQPFCRGTSRCCPSAAVASVGLPGRAGAGQGAGSGWCMEEFSVSLVKATLFTLERQMSW